jgi:hypothetical protein
VGTVRCAVYQTGDGEQEEAVAEGERGISLREHWQSEPIGRELATAQNFCLCFLVSYSRKTVKKSRNLGTELKLPCLSCRQGTFPEEYHEKLRLCRMSKRKRTEASGVARSFLGVQKIFANYGIMPGDCCCASFAYY